MEVKWLIFECLCCLKVLIVVLLGDIHRLLRKRGISKSILEVNLGLTKHLICRE